MEPPIMSRKSKRITTRVSHVELDTFCSASTLWKLEKVKVLLVDNLILKLILPMFRLDAPILLRVDWSIHSKHRQNKFQDQVVYIPGEPSYFHVTEATEKPKSLYMHWESS